jgi:Fic family protein
VADLMKSVGTDGLRRAVSAPLDGRARDRYLHWDKLRHLESPAGLTPELWWLKVKLARSDEWRRLPLRDRNGLALGFTLPDLVLRPLHRIDQYGGGIVSRQDGLVSERDARRRFGVNSMMEEAIRSSQLEGASTTRAVAKELLRSNRNPADRGERMIANNYRAIQFMREEMGQKLNPDSILDLHRILTAGTLKDPSAAGRLQTPGEERVKVEGPGGDVVWLPPPAEQLPERLGLFCAFANADEEEEPFVHPVLRAILLHFWLAYDHPFVDGNGRTARILFSWAMRSRGYWFAEYLPISRLIRQAPGRYSRAFLEAETDGGDTTYFLLQQLDTIERAIDDFHAYVERKAIEHRDLKLLLHDVEGINGRQLVLLTHALKHPDHTYTFAGHARSNRVTHETARADLGGLAGHGLLIRRRRGREYVFEPTPDLPRRLKESAA